MPRISLDQANGASSSLPNQATLRERLLNRFAAHEWVRVINIDDEPLYWQYLPIHGEEFEYTKDPARHVYRTDPEAYMLEPGESEVLIGECAYLMIENLYKKLVAKKAIARKPKVKDGEARPFNWSDGNVQEIIIDQIYLGREKPQFGEMLNPPEQPNFNRIEFSKSVPIPSTPMKRRGPAPRGRPKKV